VALIEGRTSKEIMNAKNFDQLVASIREGGAILRGQRTPSRVFDLAGPDVKAIRSRFGLSQGHFAAMLGISVATLRNWEQGRRAPEGPARVLLQVAARHPEAVWDVVQRELKQQAIQGGSKNGGSQ
jgi:putative transcriptional regulator